MTEIRLPFSITYETEGTTPVADIVVALQATDVLVKDAVSLLPSLFEGLHVEDCSLNVRSLTQESPLRELFIISVFLAFQEDLEREVPALLENMLDVTVSDKYETLVTVAFLALAFYGAGMLIDAVKKAFTDSLPRQKYEELVHVLASETGKPAGDIRQIIEAQFSQPAPARRLAKAAKSLFLPSQSDNNAPATIDRDTIPSETIREIPYPGDSDQRADFDRYQPESAVTLEIHAQDKDRSATGWAAIATGISDKRLKLRLVDPIEPSSLWGRDHIVADVVIVLKLTSEGYTPAEIQITNIISDQDNSSAKKP